MQHLEQLQAQLLEHGLHVLETGEGDRRCRPLSAWRETERALGISEAARKQKVGILRLPPETLEEARQLPAEHAIQISRLEDAGQQVELVSHASGLTHREARDAVVRLRADRELGVEEALEMTSDRSAGGNIGGGDRYQGFLPRVGSRTARRREVALGGSGSANF